MVPEHTDFYYWALHYVFYVRNSVWSLLWVMVPFMVDNPESAGYMFRYYLYDFLRTVRVVFELFPTDVSLVLGFMMVIGAGVRVVVLVSKLVGFFRRFYDMIPFLGH